MFEIKMYVVRICIALLLGYIVGLERKLRYNDAGPRTHAMVSLGACVFILVSMYGFPDSAADPSRIASCIVTGISFIGAGTIVYNKGSIRGLTTAAGIWVMAGIGMCVGTGQIILACIATASVLFFQIIAHIQLPNKNRKGRYTVEIVYEADDDYKLSDHLLYDKVLSCRYQRKDDKLICNTTVLIFSYKTSMEEIIDKLRKNKQVLSIEFQTGK